MNAARVRAAQTAIEYLILRTTGCTVEFDHVKNHRIRDLVGNGIDRALIAATLEPHVIPEMNEAIIKRCADAMTLETVILAEPPAKADRCFMEGCNAEANMIVHGKPCCVRHKADVPMPEQRPKGTVRPWAT